MGLHVKSQREKEKALYAEGRNTRVVLVTYYLMLRIGVQHVGFSGAAARATGA
jgi:hypothetical protein